MMDEDGDDDVDSTDGVDQKSNEEAANEPPISKGEVVELNSDKNLHRTADKGIRHFPVVHNMDDEFLNEYRKAAEVHRQVREYVQKIAKPGVTMSRLTDEIEDTDMGFPTGLCLNNVAAPWTPTPGGKEVALYAFTVAHNPVYDYLLDSTKAATNTGLKEAGIDARVGHISAAIQEAMESYEVTLNGKTIRIKGINNITRRNILCYKIHRDKQVPFVKTRANQRMEEGDVFAIEPFGSTGRGSIRDDVGVYGYGRNEKVNASAKTLLKLIDENFGTLLFSRRYLECVGAKDLHLGMKTLVANGMVEWYGPLVDVPWSYAAQFEHVSVGSQMERLIADCGIHCFAVAQLQGGHFAQR
ncbi:hypothetical protein EKO04_007077 [Ascochyta lentis]|uniref:Peptidase M24 domain-containing protein n=1 Tax=Ascochyta lentis TaxID=205686 RepID=A0A8H7MCQ6_9PLEO|nr:hypothetical protein EKO04_007077 [Ascochyta lentis]